MKPKKLSLIFTLPPPPSQKRANLPEEDPKGINVNRAVILPTEKLRGHVYRSTYYSTGHHCLRLTKSQISQSSTIVAIKLKEK